jgi:outer membrane protein OmpA-like peptidoglycan-associated protein
MPAEGAATGAPARESADLFLPTLIGPVGLYRVSTAEVGPLHHLRLALHGQYFRSTSFLVQGDTNSRLDGAFTFGFTIHESLELFGAILTSSNRNHRCALTSAPGTCDPEPDRRDPELIKSFGDLVLGGKGVLPVARGFTAGAELGLRFLSSISDLSFSPGSTSFWIGAVATYDLRERTRAPLRFHANANFYLDNSSNLYDFTGTTIFTREVATFAYGIQQSRIRLALGADMPLEELTAPVPLQPFVEYHAEIVTASADPAFSDPQVPQTPNNRDQQWLTLGLRARVYRGLTLDAGVDIGLRSVGYAYGPPIAPWDLTFGVSLPLDLDVVMHPTVVARTGEPSAAPAPSTGTVVGSVRAKGDGKPIADAIVGFAGLPHARVATDPDGGFSSGPLGPGPVDLTITATGYEPGKAQATVVAGTPTTVEVSLVAKLLSGNVRGRVADGAGRGVAALLRFGGASTFEARADASGAFSAALPAGPYKVTIEAAGWPNKEVPIDVAAGQDRQLDVTLRSANPDVTLAGSAIVLRKPIKFRPGVPQLDTTAKRELEGVAELLGDHPEIRKLRIEAHWNGPAGKGNQPGGTGDIARKLTEKQAGVVKDYLVSKGVSPERLEAVGAGGESPLVPNLGPANRAKNRRVELLIAP